MDPSIVAELVIYMVVLIFAISAHEAAHAWMSYKFGDDTAYLLGRVTLNPAKHIDPIGTLLIPILGFVFAIQGGGLARIPLIGWGKPTPVNPLRWRNKNVANVMVSLAGILANLTTAVFALALIKTLQATGVFPAPADSIAEPLGRLLLNGLFINASLAVFNLLPFPPLDGSKVLETFLPASFQPLLQVLEQYGFMILILLMYTGFFRLIFGPVQALLGFLVRL
jgi:Zn-dependent protease